MRDGLKEGGDFYRLSGFDMALITRRAEFHGQSPWETTIRRAKITEEIGEVTLELSGTKENLEAGTKYLEKLGIKVEPVAGDIVE